MHALSQTNPGGHIIDAVAASIAHEVRQPLTAIIMSASAGFRFLDHSPPDLDRARDAFKRIVADGHRAGAVVEDIRANFRRDRDAAVALRIDECIEGAIALKRGELDRHRVQVRMHAEADRQPPKVRGHRIQLQQVLFNLVANAIEAMAEAPEPRILSLRTSACGDGDDQVLVEVADNGPGIAASAAGQIFSPMFTTKPDGMGMGLAICRAIIEAHEGKLWFTNASRGAVFQFTLPSTSM
ncbi:sensor histidine kinase [Variovorax sp. GT1P44]|uniref:sensor histidine kinase n=1 Tax=Variovorax sp. GT1P44 TaxID=3443742 RepID=UPI003F471829